MRWLDCTISRGSSLNLGSNLLNCENLSAVARDCTCPCMKELNALGMRHINYNMKEDSWRGGEVEATALLMLL